MDLKTVTYTSLARLDLTAADVTEIHQIARRLNALDGVTGLLVFNGTRFLQTIEGSREAIDSLVERLRRDSRHSAIKIRDEQIVAERSFGDWSMELVTVSAAYMEAREQVAEALPDGVAPAIRELIVRMAGSEVATVTMPA